MLNGEPKTSLFTLGWCYSNREYWMCWKTARFTSPLLNLFSLNDQLKGFCHSFINTADNHLLLWMKKAQDCDKGKKTVWIRFLNQENNKNHWFYPRQTFINSNTHIYSSSFLMDFSRIHVIGNQQVVMMKFTFKPSITPPQLLPIYQHF